MRYFYNLLLYFLLPFLPIWLWIKSYKYPAYRYRIAERFGKFNFAPLPQSIWVHAVSVGEVLAAIPLIKELQKIYPHERIVVTVVTPTAAACVRKILGTSVLQLYIPFDYPFSLKNFLHKINPRMLVLMETELWPNMLYYANKVNVPIILANGRLSKKSYKGYKKIKPLVKSMLNNINIVAAQSKLDYEYFLGLGVSKEKAVLTGNVKFDINVLPAIIERGKELKNLWGKNRPIWVCGSTHLGEEKKILSALKSILEKHPDVLLVLVPRHPERFDKTFVLCEEQKFKTIRYSSNAAITDDVQVLIGDVMGQLLLFYVACDVAFVGGSLVPIGGHNLLEPAALAKPVIAGPHLQAFAEIKQLLQGCDALIVVHDEEELAQKVIQLLGNKCLLEKYGNAAFKVVQQNRGATQKIVAMVSSLHD